MALIAAWSILRGTAEVLAALRLRMHGRERLLVLAGLLSLVGGAGGRVSDVAEVQPCAPAHCASGRRSIPVGADCFQVAEHTLAESNDE